MTKEEVIQAQGAWADAVVGQSPNALVALYDFSLLLFKPTMAAEIRTDKPGTLSYFLGGNDRYPADKGFLRRAFTQVDFESACGPVLVADGLSAQDMGHYYFKSPDGSILKADYSFIYKKSQGKTLITLHHSSFNIENES
jgi:hypothetical protein